MKTYRISDGDLYGDISEDVTGSLEDARTAAREWVEMRDWKAGENTFRQNAMKPLVS